MAETHQDWLKRKETESLRKQESFMNGIAARLRRPRVTEPPAHPYRGVPDFWKSFEWTPEERIARFTENFQSVGGWPMRLPGLSEAGRFIADKAAELGARRVIRHSHPDVDALGLEDVLPDGVEMNVWNSGEDDANWKAKAAEADFGVIAADAAAAYTGSIAVLSSGDRGRSVSLLPTVLFAIIPVERLFTRLGEIMIDFDRRGRDALPAGIHFISGPSRSADIENDLTIGVHGPGIVYALIVG